MKPITRREILRRLGGASVVTALGGTAYAITHTGEPATGGEGIEASGRYLPPSSTASVTSPDTVHPAARPPSTTNHAHSDTTDVHGDTTQVHADTTAPASPTSSAPDSTTTSAPPAVAVSTTQLAGVVGATTISSGQVATIVGDVDLQGDLVVEGILTGVGTFTLQGNGHQIEIRNGGLIDLQGVVRSGWIRGASPNGWQAGDRVVSTPVGPGLYGIGDFGGGSPQVVSMADGRTIAAEQFNLTRSIVINNVSRIMFHMGAGRQVLRYLAVTNSGIAGEKAFYPIHFHLNGGTTRGSIVEGVVVENGQNHAFVPHASHGITFLDCVAFNTIGDAYWWDPPPGSGDTSNDTHDTVWQHCLAAFVVEQGGSSDHRLTAFRLGGGTGNRCIDSTAVAVHGGKNSSGFHWPEQGGAVWEFRGCVAHNNVSTGIFTWQNGSAIHEVDDFIAYRCGRAGIEHGAYRNNYQYRSVSLTDTSVGVIAHALSKDDGLLLFEGVSSNNDLLISQHNQASTAPVVYRSCRFPRVVLQEVAGGKGEPGVHELVDTGLQPDNVDISAIHRATIFRISEAGRLRWEWARGSWTAL